VELVYWHSTTLTDKNVSLTRPIYSQLGAEGIKDLHQRTGAPIHSAYALPQLRALYANPEHYDLCERIVIWQTVASLCLSRWRGTPFSHMSFSEASWTGLFNFKLCEWDRVALSLLPEECRHSLPPLADYSDTTMPSGGMPEIVGEAEPESNPYWARWPELRGSNDSAEHCSLFLGIGDGACANVGSKCTAPRRIAVTIGTSAAARLCLALPVSPSPITDAFVVPHGLFCYRLDRNHVVVGGALTDGGSIVDWARKMLSLTDDAQFQDCLNGAALLYNKDYQSVVDGDSSSAPVVVPFLSGERSPQYREGACFALMGLTRDSGPAHFLKSCLEGVILRIEAILRLLRDCDEAGETPAILVSGTALERNALWRQMLADCSGLEVQLDQSVTEATSRGVARLVSIALAMKREYANPNSASYLTEERVSSPRVSHPHLAATEGYWLVAYDSQENLIDAISPLWSLN
jgi:gluconokinase